MKDDMDRIQRDADDTGQIEHDENRVPISGAPGALGAQPTGKGSGSASGSVAGAAIGIAGGLIGVAVGLVAGVVAGGRVGKGVAGKIETAAEDVYWREEHVKRGYNPAGEPYELYQSAYRTGYEGFGRYPGRTYEEVEADLQRYYESSPGSTDLPWEQAKQAVRDAWNRMKDSVSPDDSHSSSH